MKYIIFESQSGLDVPIIFANSVDHSTIANSFSYLKPISAGFCKPDALGKMSVWGKSVTLGGLPSRPVDGELLNIAFDLY